MPLIAVTRLRVRSARYFPGFLYHVLRSARQVKRAAGNLGMRLLRDSDRTFWTCSAWQDENAMRAFMKEAPHRHAMGKLAQWCNEASVVHWDVVDAELPDWHEAHRRMVTEGRRSRVNDPSPEHEAYEIRAPRVT